MKITRGILDRIVAQARAEAPNEACGYLAGADGVADFAIPMRNVDASPQHFAFDPKEQFAAVRQARAAGLDLIAVYHSHPATPARMSAEDIRLANDTSVVYLIYSLVESSLKGFRVTRDRALRDEGVEVIEVSASRR